MALIFSVLNMFKAAISLNVIRIHTRAVTNANQFWDFMVKVCDHLPFLAATSFFRISAITLCLTYINIWAILPIALYWISNLFVGYRKFRLEHMPLWLISFISIFVPACFTSS